MLPRKPLKLLPLLASSLLLALPAQNAEAHFIGPWIPEPLIKIDRALKKLYAFHCADREPGAVSLLEAAEKGDADAVRKAVAEGANVDARNGDCNSAVWLAAYNGHWEVVNALFEAGARDKPNAGESALGRAASFNCFEKDEIKTGNASILTVIDGNNIEEFSISILKINPHEKAIKNILFEVTDDRLLSISGGIVQGMSGSPIIQGDKIIGAVTHVVVDDCTKGYGILITNMLEEAEN